MYLRNGEKPLTTTGVREKTTRKAASGRMCADRVFSHRGGALKFPRGPGIGQSRPPALPWTLRSWSRVMAVGHEFGAGTSATLRVYQLPECFYLTPRCPPGAPSRTLEAGIWIMNCY